MSLLATVDRTALETLRTTPTPFLTKTYQIVDDPAVDDVISWNSEGSAFVVHRPAEFARDLIPKYFKHNNFSSFVRQLNTYGFRKIVSERWEFANDCFKKGEKQLLKEIHRRKLTTGASPAIPLAVPLSQGGSPAASGEEQVPSSSNSSSGNTTARSTVEIVEENERLRKENEELSKELEQMKRFCNSVFVLMSKNRENLKEEEGEGSEGMRLFGVSIGSKRKRGEEPNPTVDRGSDSQHWMVCYPKSEQRVRSG